MFGIVLSYMSSFVVCENLLKLGSNMTPNCCMIIWASGA